MDEPPARLMSQISRLVEDTVDEALEQHEEEMHIPPPRRGRLKAIPFPGMSLSDTQTARAREMLERGATLDDVLLALDVPLSVLERALAEFKPAWRNFLAEREAGA